jgi:hypothetical protein
MGPGVRRESDWRIFTNFHLNLNCFTSDQARRGNTRSVSSMKDSWLNGAQSR